MKTIFYQRWTSHKEMQDVETSISVLDGYNKTRFSRKKTGDSDTLLEAAKYAHDHEKIYFITVFEKDAPYCYLEINKGFYRVNFLDELLRLYLSYDFYGRNYDETYGNKLFLGKATFWEFDGATDKKVKITDYMFSTDESLTIIERNQLTNEQIDSKARNKINVAANWEDYPEFGKYDSLIRKERDLKLS